MKPLLLLILIGLPVFAQYPTSGYYKSVIKPITIYDSNSGMTMIQGRSRIPWLECYPDRRGRFIRNDGMMGRGVAESMIYSGGPNATLQVIPSGQYPTVQRLPDNYLLPDGKLITDSTVWRVTAVMHVGDSTCRHDWVEGGVFSIYHNLGIPTEHYKSRICRDCLRKERLKRFIIQHRELPPETEYERLDRQIRTR